MRPWLLLVCGAVMLVPVGAGADFDCDRIEDAQDVCPFVFDPDQADADGDGTGDACLCGDQTGDGRLDIGDLLGINAALFDPTQVTERCDANNDQACDILDILAVNAAIFGGETSCGQQFPDPAPFCVAGQICDPERLLIRVGRGENNFHVDQWLHLGAGVQQFDLELGFTTTSPGDPPRYSPWPAGVSVEIFDASGALVDSLDDADVSADPDAPLRTSSIPGHRARIVVSSGGSFVDLGTATSLLIRDIRPALGGAPPPAGFDQALELTPGVEALGYLARAGEEAHGFWADLPGPGRYSIYVSPFHMEPPWHDIGVEASWTIGSPDDVLPAQWDSTAQPREGDTGIYREVVVPDAEPRRIFLSVDGDRSAFYRITVQSLRELVGDEADPLVVEMDGILDGDTAPTCATGVVAWASAYGPQIRDFITTEADYNRRVVEALVVYSASLLAATEGYSRLHRLDFFHSFDSLRDADISFDGDCGRANAHFHSRVGPIAAIQLFREQVNQPFIGGIVLLHEWGHYRFSIFDEYTDAGGTVDENSSMASQRSGIEFCGDLNHDDTGDDGTILGPDSAWSNVENVLGAGPPRPPTSPVHYPQNRGIYMDVLNELEALLTIVEFPNPSPTGLPVNGRCLWNGLPCSSNRDCAFDGVCDAATSVCVSAEGTGFGWCNHDSQCASNRCTDFDGCAPLGQIGNDCSDGRICAGGRRCDVGPTSQNTGRCIPDDGEGQPSDFCSHDRQCMIGSSCLLEAGQNFGACALPTALGGECSSNAGCLSGACDIPARVCVPINGTGGEGDFCTQDPHCQSNACELGACLPFAQIGEICSDGRICSGGRRCDTGFGSQNTGRCIPNDFEGQPGEFCSHDNHCVPGDTCLLDPGQNSGVCASPADLGGECSSNAGCTSGACDTAERACVPLNGTGTTGAFCTQGAQCQSNSCSGANTCRSFAAIGEVCSNGRICAGGRRCDTGVGSQNTGRCIPDDGQGQPGQFCSHDNHCRPGDFCDITSGNSGLCAEPRPLGQTCGRNQECLSGACDPSADVCVPVNGTGSTGSFCTQGAQCQSNACSGGACLSFAAIGEICSTGRICSGGRRCDVGFGSQNTGRCIPNDGQGLPGQFCSHDNQCIPGDFCDINSGNSGVCSDPLPLGSSCNGNAECASGACDASADVCVPVNGTGSTGSFCTQSAQCQSNSCSGGACQSFAAIGEICLTGRICAGGRRCDVGIGTQNTGRCIPDDGEGQSGDFCSHNNQCMPGRPCLLEPGQNFGSCF